MAAGARSSIVASSSIRSLICGLHQSAMFLPPIRVPSATGFSRAPSHAGQGPSEMNRSPAARVFSLRAPVSRLRCRRVKLSNRPSYFSRCVLPLLKVSSTVPPLPCSSVCSSSAVYSFNRFAGSSRSYLA